MIIEQLSSLLDDTAELEPWTLTDAELREVTRSVHRARAGLDELAVRLVGAADDRGLAREDGCTSATAWLAQTAALSAREASRLVSLSRTDTELLTATRRAWATGNISTDQAGVILRAISALPEWIGEEERHDAEQVMLENASHLSVEHLRKLGNHIVEVIDPDGAEEIIGKQLQAEEKKAYDSTRLHLSDNGHGLTHIRGQIPTAQADMLRTAVEALSAPRRRHLLDTETVGPHGDPALGHPDHAQRIGWAFCELIEHLPQKSLPQAGGLAATVTIDIDLAALKSQIGRAGISTGNEMSASQARRIACNAHLIPLVMDGESKILDLTQTRRLHDRYQRQAIVRRDKGCCWKGCSRPPAWCEVHHPDPYSQGGATTVDNGALFCFIHHHLLHDSDWHARLAPDGIIEVIPPTRIDPHQRPLRHARHTKLQPRAA